MSATPQTYTVTFTSGPPGQGNVIATYNESITSVADTIKAAANKFTGGSISGPATLAIGSTFDVIIQGSTGTVGNPVIAYTPATLPNWLASSFQLQATKIQFTSGDLNGVVVNNRLSYTPSPSPTSNSAYTETFTFRAINATATSTSLNPISYIGSGTQVKHTDTGTWATLPAISPVVNNLRVALSAGAISNNVSTITLTVQNTGTVAATLDHLVADLTSGLSYVSGSSTLDGVAYSNPTTTNGRLLWSDAFSVAPMQSLTLTFGVNVPVESNEQISGFAKIGDTQIDVTAPTGDNVPAQVVFGVDVTPPAAPVVAAISQDTATPGDGVTSDRTLLVSGTAEPLSTVAVYRGAVLLGVAAADARGSWAFDATGIPLPDGPYAFTATATATDLAGNTSALSPALAVVVDSVAPSAPLVTTPTSDESVGTATATVAGTAEAGSLVSLYDDSNGNGVLDGTETIIASARLDPGQTSFTFTVPLRSSADHHFLATATDAAGNQSAPSSMPTITQAAPGLTVTGPAAPVTVSGDTAVVIGTAASGSLVRLYADTNGDGVIDDGEVVVGTQQLAPGQTTYAIDVALTRGVANHFLATGTGADGIESGPSPVPTITQATAPVPIPVTPMAHGTVFLDLNVNGLLDAGEPGLAGRYVYADLNHDGTFDDGDTSPITDAGGFFAFTNVAAGSAGIFEATGLDASDRYVVDQFHTEGDGGVSIAAVPYSPIAPVPVVPSPFTATPDTNPESAYVRSLYLAVLGRAGGEAEVDGWMAKEGHGMTRQEVARGFVNSVEHRQQQVEADYEEYLHRGPDSRSVFWVDELLAGVSEETVTRGFLESPEYQAAHTDPADLVRDLYLDVLGRRGETTGLAAWQSALATGMSRGAAESYFVESAEAIDQIVEGFYAAYLHRQRETETSDFWVRMLAQPDGSATDVATGVLTSLEFEQDATSPEADSHAGPAAGTRSIPLGPTGVPAASFRSPLESCPRTTSSAAGSPCLGRGPG